MPDLGSVEHIEKLLKIEQVFYFCCFFFNLVTIDLYFFGPVKKLNNKLLSLSRFFLAQDTVGKCVPDESFSWNNFPLDY